MTLRHLSIPIAIMLSSCSHEPAAAPVKASLTPVKIQRIERQTLAQETEYTANIAPETQVNVAFRVGGYVDRVMQVQGRAVQEGDPVAQGAVLASLRPADFSTKLNQAKAQQAQTQASLAVSKSQLADAKANLDDSQADLARAKNLFASQSLTKTDLDRAQARALSAQAKVEAALGQIQAVEAQINGAAQIVRDAELAVEDSALKAPLSGVILKKAIEPGALAAPGAPAFVIANTGTVKAVFGIPDTVIATFKPGQILSVEAEAVPGAGFRGRISNISPSADPKSRAFDVDVSIPNGNGRLRIGMIATVKIGGQAQPVLVVPLSAVVRSKKNPDQYAVYTLDGDGERATARLREIQIGKTVNTGIVLLGGLEEGARVITAGSSMISDGEQVQIVP